MENWDIEDFFNGMLNLNDTNYQNSSIKDQIINNIREDIINGNIDLSNVLNGNKTDLLIKNNDTYYQITSSDNQKNNKYNNISTILLGECEKILKNIYHIKDNLTLIIFKIDYFPQDSLIPIIGYEIFHPETKEKLSLTHCKDQNINYNIPVTINEDILFKYDPNNEYYTDECIPSTTENGADILLNDRKDEFNNKKMSLCENNCTFDGYEKNSKKAICKCEIKYQQLVISQIANKNDILYNNFNSTIASSRMITLKCYKTLFTKEGMVNNIGNFLLIIIIILFTLCGIFFSKCGYNFLQSDINKIIEEKAEKNKVNLEKIYTIKKLEIKSPKKGKKKKKRKKKNSIEIILNNQKSFSKSDLKNMNKSSDIIENIKNTTINEEAQKTIFNSDYELNTMSYKRALKYDKRKLSEYYISLIRTKHPIIFTFCTSNDYNSRIVKFSLFLLGFSFYYGANALFFNESTIHKIYEERGIYNFTYLGPYIVISFIISHTLITIIKYFVLSENNFYEIKNEKNFEIASDKAFRMRKCLFIKYILYFPIGFIILVFLWYYLSSFGAVYQNTQVYLIKNTIISFCLSFLYPFAINLLPGILRNYALNDKNKKKEFLYEISKKIQLI